MSNDDTKERQFLEVVEEIRKKVKDRLIKEGVPGGMNLAELEGYVYSIFYRKGGTAETVTKALDRASQRSLERGDEGKILSEIFEEVFQTTIEKLPQFAELENGEGSKSAENSPPVGLGMDAPSVSKETGQVEPKTEKPPSVRAESPQEEVAGKKSVSHELSESPLTDNSQREEEKEERREKPSRVEGRDRNQHKYTDGLTRRQRKQLPENKKKVLKRCKDAIEKDLGRKLTGGEQKCLWRLLHPFFHGNLKKALATGFRTIEDKLIDTYYEVMKKGRKRNPTQSFRSPSDGDRGSPKRPEDRTQGLNI